MNTFLKAVVIAAGVLLLFKSCGPLMRGPHPLTGQAAPEFTLAISGGGSEVALSFLRAGQPAIIFFWATWCPHCREQLAELARRREEMAAEEIKIILVDVGEDLGKVAAYLDEKNIPLETFLDEDGRVARDYKIVGVPTFFLVDAEGIVKAVKHALPSNYREVLLGGLVP